VKACIGILTLQRVIPRRTCYWRRESSTEIAVATQCHLSLQGKAAVVDPGLEGHLFISMGLDFESQLSMTTAGSQVMSWGSGYDTCVILTWGTWGTYFKSGPRLVVDLVATSPSIDFRSLLADLG
jgi:hypothetical protein